MAISVDIHPSDQESQLFVTASAMATSGDPVMITISDSKGKYIGDVTLFMRAPAMASRLARAINEAIGGTDAAKDAIEELIGSNDEPPVTPTLERYPVPDDKLPG
jgi:hypothetical protein